MEFLRCRNLSNKCFKVYQIEYLRQKELSLDRHCHNMENCQIVGNILKSYIKAVCVQFSTLYTDTVVLRFSQTVLIIYDNDANIYDKLR